MASTQQSGRLYVVRTTFLLRDDVVHRRIKAYIQIRCCDKKKELEAKKLLYQLKIMLSTSLDGLSTQKKPRCNGTAAQQFFSVEQPSLWVIWPH